MLISHVKRVVSPLYRTGFSGTPVQSSGNSRSNGSVTSTLIESPYISALDRVRELGATALNSIDASVSSPATYIPVLLFVGRGSTKNFIGPELVDSTGCSGSDASNAWDDLNILIP